ncbi:hypothetical protein [Pseudomonas sp. TMP25]
MTWVTAIGETAPNVTTFGTESDQASARVPSTDYSRCACVLF